MFSPFHRFLGVALLSIGLTAAGQSLVMAQPQTTSSAKSTADLQRFEISVPSMGSRLDLVVYAADESSAQRIIEAGLNEVDRLGFILSNYDPLSEISRLNAAPVNTPFALSRELGEVLQHSQRWHELSEGKFDITVGPLTQLWRNARKQKKLPTANDIELAKQRCGWKFVALGNKQTVAPKSIELSAEHMFLDLSGIAVGYIVDQAFEKMVEEDCTVIMINAGGDIRVGRAPPNKPGWKIEVAGLGKDSPPIANLILENCAVTTSGDLVQFVEIDDRRYSHFIDPESGMPIERRQSVTVVADTCVDADAGATALAVLGMERASELFESLPLKEAIHVQSSSHGSNPIRMRYLTKAQ